MFLACPKMMKLTLKSEVKEFKNDVKEQTAKTAEKWPREVPWIDKMNPQKKNAI